MIVEIRPHRTDLLHERGRVLGSVDGGVVGQVHELDLWAAERIDHPLLETAAVQRELVVDFLDQGVAGEPWSAWDSFRDRWLALAATLSSRFRLWPPAGLMSSSRSSYRLSPSPVAVVVNPEVPLPVAVAELGEIPRTAGEAHPGEDQGGHGEQRSDQGGAKHRKRPPARRASDGAAE